MSAHNRRHSSPSSRGAREEVSQELVEEHPNTATFIAFGIGVSVGLLVGRVVSEPVIRLWQPRPSTMEKFGRQVYDAIRDSLPESLGRHLRP
jgi:hypothetical protein